MSRDNDIEIIETERKIPEDRTGPQEFPLKAAVFREGGTSVEQKIRVFGNLSIEGDISDRSDGSVRTDVASMEMLSEFQFNKSPSALCPTENEQVWILENLSDEISLVNQSGQTNRILKCEARIQDISVSPVTNNLWMACIDRKVREVRTSTFPVVKFRVKDIPHSICVTNQDNVVIGMMRKIAIYSNMGYIQRVMDKFSSLARMLRKPSHICESHTSGEMAIVVNDNLGKNKIHVTIIDSSLQLKYHHSGDSIVMRNGSVRQSGYAPTRAYEPLDACYDGYDNLLITDKTNKAIIIVKSRGKHILSQLLLGDDREPCVICVQDGKFLWVGFIDGTVKVFRYHT